MTLEQILAITDENKNVSVFNSCCDCIATYDGKNSIPVEMNGETVTDIVVVGGCVCIEIDANRTECKKKGYILR